MNIQELENKSIYLVRESFYRFKNLALLWSMGKDSTALLWLCRKAFFGKLPFPVVHIDTSYKFKEIYEFRQRYSKAWGLDLIIAKNEAALQSGMDHRKGRFECCTALKTQTLAESIKKHRFQAIMLAIRRDEHGIRAKERYFSPRDANQVWNYQNQPLEPWGLAPSGIAGQDHYRVHPMLDWTEIDIWEYTQREKIPFIDLYLARGQKRFRSIGCETCCLAVESGADSIPKIIQELKTTRDSERGGRAQDKEDAYMMQKLRSLGYM